MPIDTSNNDSAQIIKTLNMGSGVDIQALAKNLSEAENQARLDRVNAKKGNSEATISGMGALSSAIGSLKSQLNLMKNISNLITSKHTSSNQNLRIETLSSNTSPGSYSVSVKQLARPQLSSFSVNSDSDISNLSSLSIAGIGVTINVGDSAQDLVERINSLDLDVNAQLINKKSQVDANADGQLDDDWVITLQGSNGSESAYNVTVNGVDYVATQTAQDAEIEVNGVTIYRSDNVVSDVIKDTKLDFTDVPAGTTVSITNSKSFQPVRDLLTTFAEMFNDVITVADALSGDTNDDEPLAGSLAKERSLINTLQTQLKNMIDTTAGHSVGSLDNLRDLGLNFSAEGKLQIEDKIFDSVMDSSASDVVKMLSANLDNQSQFAADGDKGLLLQLSVNLDSLIGPEGTLTNRVDTENDRIADYEDQLIDLEARLQKSYQRYIEQFAAMEGFIQQSKDMRSYLENQFKAMQNQSD
jgi:flagellar hook-associated protein 2